MQARAVSVANAGCQAELVNEELSRIKYACRLREELIFRRAICFKVRLMQRTRRFLYGEISRKRRQPQPRDDRLGGGAHRPGFTHRLPGLVQQAAGQVLPNAWWKELQLPALHRRNETRPENRPAAEVELWFLTDIV